MELRAKWMMAPLAAALGAAVGGTVTKRVWLAKYRAQKEELAAAKRESELLYAWLRLERQGKKLADCFDALGWRRIAVLGMNRLGRMAADELGERSAYGVEAENFNAVHERLTVYRLGEDPLPEADGLLICDTERVGEIRKAVDDAFPGEIVTLQEALEWLSRGGPDDGRG